MTKFVNRFLGEKSGQSLKAEIYEVDGGYSIEYFINDTFQTRETITGHNILFVEDAAENWINGIKVLNG